MLKYKVTKVFIFEANSKAEAQTIVAARPDEVLEFMSIVEQSPAKQAGWFGAVKSQVTGK